MDDAEYRRLCYRVSGLRSNDEFHAFTALVERLKQQEFSTVLVSRMDSYESYLEHRAMHAAYERVLRVVDEAWDVVSKHEGQKND